MIIGSLLLILVAAALVVVGLVQASNVLLIGAIVACGVAAVLVYWGSRQAINPVAPVGGHDVDGVDELDVEGHLADRVPAPLGHLGGSAFGGPDKTVVTRAGDRRDGRDPADEPAAQAVGPEIRSRIARLNTEVLVVDGRPRFHLIDCSYLVDQDSEALPVSEAQALGFSSCGLCKPATFLVGLG